jgi:HEPN domain-containing protein
MKRREQALRYLRKAAQDEVLLDAVLTSEQVSDEIFGFHCQQATEKLLKALLSDLGVRFRKTHEIGALSDLLADAGCPLPEDMASLDALTPYGVFYRYEDYDVEPSLDWPRAREMLRSLRVWVEERLAERAPAA